MKTKNLILALAMALVSTAGFAQFTSSLMSDANTAHNFANGDGGDTGAGYAFALADGSCAVCHTPHNAGTQLPLWNRDGSDPTDFTVYTNAATMDGTTDLAGGGSLLCLSCHDGSANLDSYGSTAYVNPGTGIAIQPGALADGYAIVGFDLSNDHPVGVTYPTDANAPGEQMKLASTFDGLGAVLYNNKVECASCHSMHNPAVTSKLLVRTNAASALCIECHAK